MGNKIQSIQALRGIAAMLVVLGHVGAYLNGAYVQANLGDLLFGNGAVGVDIFFVISGFIIALATEKKENFNCVKFIIKRFFRLYPVYVFCFLLFSVVATKLFTLDKSQIPLWFNYEDIKNSLLFLPLRTDEPAPFYGYSLILTAWTLSYEVYFYFIFCLAMAISHKYRSLISAIAIIAISMIVQFSTIDNYYFDAHTIRGLDYSRVLTIIGNPISIDFILGIIAFYIFKVTKNIKLGTKTKIASSIGVVFGILCWNSGFMFGHGITKFGGIAFIIFMSVVFGELTFKFNVNKSLIHLGDISYSLYLCHVIVIFAYNEFGKFVPFIPQNHGVSLFLFILSVSIALSYAMYKWIEQPSIKLSHGICKKM
ncbi:acyltransferase [Citrobacter portucalensis]|nr:acyltransferase [Citrobacter portucalensis]MDE9663488.1 acyltransferase [Citrobacter portucalensis]MDE9672584.1 acyltransferase [Citrobacter portucalensis]